MLLAGCVAFQPVEPTLTPTPDESAIDGEVLILVANFAGVGGAAAADLLSASLREEAATADLMPISVRRVADVVPASAEDAQALGDDAGANVVVWGTYADGALNPVYQLIEGYEREALVGLPATIPLPPPTSEEGQATAQFAYLTLYGLGKTAVFQESYDEAIDLLTRALSLPIEADAPNLSLAYFYRGYSYQLTDRPQAALADYTYAIDADAAAYYAYINRGYLRQIVNGELEAALADYMTAIDLLLDITGGGVDGSEQQFDALAVAYNNAIQIYLREEDWPTMIDMAGGLLSVMPDNTRALSYRGTAREELGDLDGALADYDAALAADPQDIYALASRGTIFEQMGRREEALADYERFFDLASGSEYFYPYIQERYETLSASVD